MGLIDRLLLKNLLVFREQVFRHVDEDWTDVLARAAKLWSPRWRSAAPGHPTTQHSAPGGLLEAGVSEDVVQVEERPLADVWVPGRILHIYVHRGVFRVAAVPRDFLCLRRIEVQGNIFDDHKSLTIMEALLEVSSQDAACGCRCSLLTSQI